MLFTSGKKNSRIIAINFLILGLLFGYQNCADNGAAFSAREVASASGSTYRVLGLGGDRYINDEDIFTVQPTGGTQVPQRVDWTVVTPSGASTTHQGITLNYTYTVIGVHTYSVLITGANSNDQVEYNFTVDALPRPGNCGPVVGGSSLYIDGPNSLAAPGRTRFNVEYLPECFNVTQAPVWRIKNSSGVDIINQPSGLVEIFPNDKAIEYTFAQGGYIIEADVFVAQLNQIVTLTRQLTVNMVQVCNPSDINLNHSPRVIPGTVNFALAFPTCYDRSRIVRYSWYFNHTSSMSLPSVETTGPQSSNNYVNLDGLIRMGAAGYYQSDVRIVLHDVSGSTQIIDRSVTLEYQEPTLASVLEPIYNVLNPMATGGDYGHRASFKRYTQAELDVVLQRTGTQQLPLTTAAEKIYCDIINCTYGNNLTTKSYSGEAFQTWDPPIFLRMRELGQQNQVYSSSRYTTHYLELSGDYNGGYFYRKGYLHMDHQLREYMIVYTFRNE